MSELVLTAQATPAGIGANMVAVFYTAGNALAFVDQLGVVHAVPASDAGGNLTANTVTLTGNLAVGANFTANGRVNLDANITATVGDVTINKAAGRAIVANASTTVVVTNNFVTANSLVFAVAAANDLTGFVRGVVAAAGNFTIHCNAPSANMPVNFVVVNG